MKIFSISIFGFILLIILNTISVQKKFKKKTEKALNDYSMLPDDVKVTDKVILGRGEDTYRPGAISLICTNQNNVLLLVQDRRPTRHGKAGGFGEGFFKGSDNNASKYGYGETKISNMTYLSRGYFDVYVSDPLLEEEIASILEILEIKGIAQVKISAFDGGNVFTVEFDLSKVTQLINTCQS